MSRTFFEFFAGGGMVRAGLGSGWKCLFANDFSPLKAAAYRANWGEGDLSCCDVGGLEAADLPGAADLAWASFPCQDLSLAGEGLGLGRPGASATRSGAFWSFWNVIRALRKEGRAPTVIVLENVCGVLTSRGGADFAAIGAAFAASGYRFGALIIDAVRFVPQSRPRVFFVAIAGGGEIPVGVSSSAPHPRWHGRALQEAQGRLSSAVGKRWVWWTLPEPPARTSRLRDLVETNPIGVRWRSAHETQRLLAMMSPLHLAKIESAIDSGARCVGGVYRRTRADGNGARRQRAEVRFDDVAGCLRTPAGGSSRQTLLFIEGNMIRSRLMSPREAARLMGLPDDYILPMRYNEAYHLVGDGVCVPLVRHLAHHLLEKLVANEPSVGDSVAA